MREDPPPEKRRAAENKPTQGDASERPLQENEVGICWVETATGRFLKVNPKYCEITGRTEQDLLSRTFESITHPEDVAENSAQLQRLARGEVRNYAVEKRYMRPDGSVRWAGVEIVAMGPEREPPVWHMAIAHDITERRQTAARLQEYERVVEGVEDMIVVVDRNYRCLIANRAFLNYRGSGKKEVLGHLASELTDSTTFETLVRPRIDECFQGKVVEYEIKYNYPKLGERDMHMSYFPIKGPAGIDRIVSITRDVTERKQAEGRLREFERVIESLEENIFVVDREYRFRLANRAFLNRRGLGKEQVIGRSLEDLLASDGTAEEAIRLVKEKINECFQGKVIQYEMKYIVRHAGGKRATPVLFPHRRAYGRRPSHLHRCGTLRTASGPRKRCGRM